MEFLIYSLLTILILILAGWFTGTKEYVWGPKNDERKQLIKQKSIVQSWVTVFLALLSNLVGQYLHIGPQQMNVSPECFYLILLIVSYIVFYIFNTKQMSAS